MVVAVVVTVITAVIVRQDSRCTERHGTDGYTGGHIIRVGLLPAGVIDLEIPHTAVILLLGHLAVHIGVVNSAHLGLIWRSTGNQEHGSEKSNKRANEFFHDLGGLMILERI
jgi:hypothetical protein